MPGEWSPNLAPDCSSTLWCGHTGWHQHGQCPCCRAWGSNPNRYCPAIRIKVGLLLRFAGSCGHAFLFPQESGQCCLHDPGRPLRVHSTAFRNRIEGGECGKGGLSWG